MPHQYFHLLLFYVGHLDAIRRVLRKRWGLVAGNLCWPVRSNPNSEGLRTYSPCSRLAFVDCHSQDLYVIPTAEVIAPLFPAVDFDFDIAISRSSAATGINPLIILIRAHLV